MLLSMMSAMEAWGEYPNDLSDSIKADGSGWTISKLDTSYSGPRA